jgi:hypothetical protein
VSEVGVRYDAARARWLPAGIATPDGVGYVYGDDSGAVHLVNLDSGLDHVIVQPAWRPVAFAGGRLYLAQIQRASYAGTTGYVDGGLGWVNPTGGLPTLVTKHAGFWWVSEAGGWTVDRADGLQQAPDRVLHADLVTGALEPWLTSVPQVTIAGFDGQGHPFAIGEGDQVHAFLLLSKASSKEVYAGARVDGWPAFPSYAGGGRVWFSGFSIKDPSFEAPAWTYDGSHLHPAITVSGAQVTVAGPCR